MLQAQLKALLAEGNTDFAIHPTTIESRIPHGLPTTVTDLRTQCPTGLVKGTVVEDGHHWTERYTFGCGGDKVHETPRKNGVLVEVAFLDLPARYGEKIRDLDDLGQKERLAAWKKVRLATPFKREGEQFFRLVISRKCVFAPWGEYAMVEAEREKIQAESDARYKRLSDIADRLGIKRDRSERYSRVEWRSEGFPQDPKQRDDHHKKLIADADEIGQERRFNDLTETRAFFGSVTMPLKKAEKIADALDALKEIANGKGKAANIAAEALVEMGL